MNVLFFLILIVTIIYTIIYKILCFIYKKKVKFIFVHNIFTIIVFILAIYFSIMASNTGGWNSLGNAIVASWLFILIFFLLMTILFYFVFKKNEEEDEYIEDYENENKYESKNIIYILKYKYNELKEIMRHRKYVEKEKKKIIIHKKQKRCQKK